MLRLGVIGLGQRGTMLLRDVMLETEAAEVTAVCDLYADRTEEAAELAEKKYGRKIFTTNDYHEILTNENVDCVIIATDWETHIPIAIDSMKAGKPTAMEVGGAYSIKQCWDLVNTYESTKTPFMLLENCCYGKRELMALNMIKKGVFGEIVHCSGGYCHDLRDEISFGKENRHYRLRNYLARNCENYPTHELGPIAKVLNINHGNRMLSLTSTASKARGLSTYIAEHKSDDAELMNAQFAQGDIVTTVIKCAGGETIALTLDTTLPRFYSRGFTVRGTKGMYEEATDSIFLDGEDPETHFNWKPHWGNAEEYEEEYLDDTWRQYIKDGVQQGHGGIDWLVMHAFFDAVENNKPCPIDVYDAASWMCITALSEKSIALGSVSVDIPDFTNGEWIRR